jgi:TolB protein
MRAGNLLLAAAVAAGVATATLIPGATGAGGAGKQAQAGPSTGEILYALSASGRSDLYLVRGDGTGRRRLTRLGSSTVGIGQARWAPDAQRIAFVRGREQYTNRAISDIFVADRPGAPARAVTSTGTDHSPAWSPDGRRIAFSRSIRGNPEYPPRAEIWVMDADGSAQRRVTQGTYDVEPAWAPDGGTVVFTRVTFQADSLAARAALYVVSAGGGAPRLLADHAASGDWSPDGSRIAFVSDRDRYGETCFHECAPNSEIYVMRADGSQQVRITRSRGDDQSPHWSPDGTRLAFASDRAHRDGNAFELYSVAPTGGCPVRLTNSSASAGDPDWRPTTGAIRVPRAQRCVRGYRSTGRRATVDTPLAAARGFRGPSLFWLGRVFDGLMVTRAQGNGRVFDFTYDDCGRNPGRCSGPIQVQITSICQRHPLAYGPGPPGLDDLARRRGTFALRSPGGDFVEVYTGRSAVTMFGIAHDARRARRVITALRRFGSPRTRGALPYPRFPASMVRDVRRVERAYRQTRSVDRVRRRLGISRSAVRFYLAFGARLRTLGRLRTSAC